MLGMLGIYGVMSYTVAQQTREIGIRVALGADRRQLARLIVGKALRLSVAGVGAGLVLAHARGALDLEAVLRRGPADVVTLGGACAC